MKMRLTRATGATSKNPKAPPNAAKPWTNKAAIRLLRNRVSAQQARERKKAYMSDLETEMLVMGAKMAEMEVKINTMEKENSMLRQVVKNETQALPPVFPDMVDEWISKTDLLRDPFFTMPVSTQSPPKSDELMGILDWYEREHAKGDVCFKTHQEEKENINVNLHN
jgi:hypothetical protein